MCRNIKQLFNFDPPATDEEIRNAALQFARKLSGIQKPAASNESAFNQAVEEIATSAKTLLHSLQTNAKPKNREEEAEKARVRSQKRFGSNQINE
jgi:hypothetical protein